jgi:hypothetical protein
MVRWSYGLYGGLIAGVTSALFYAVVTVAWLHETTLGTFFAQIARALPPLHGAPDAPPIVALGVVLHFLAAGAFGLVYGLLALRFASMRQAPGSVLWGVGYGLLVWFAINDVIVPVTGAENVQPFWEGLLGTVVFYGIVLSEATATVARRDTGAGGLP